MQRRTALLVLWLYAASAAATPHSSDAQRPSKGPMYSRERLERVLCKRVSQDRLGPAGRDQLRKIGRTLYALLHETDGSADLDAVSTGGGREGTRRSRSINV